MANITTHDEAWDGDQADEQHYEAASIKSGFKAFITGPYPTLVSRFVLGSIMFLAGISKIGVPETMKVGIRAYEIPLPDFVVNVMAVGLPILEVALGAWLILGLFTRISGLIAAVLMAVFTVAITSAWMRGLDISCGCFGGAEANSIGLGLMTALGPIGEYLANERANLETIVRDIVLTLMGLHLFFVPSIFSLDRLRQRSAQAETEEA
jgi:uncharacterized membrane protein YphA (DoxX/SURF4 family)